MRSNRASKTGIQLKMFRKQLTKQFRGLPIIHTVEQCEGSNFSSGSQWLNLVRDEVILRKVNDPDSTPLDSIQLWQWGRSCTKPCTAGIFHLWSDDGLFSLFFSAKFQICLSRVMLHSLRPFTRWTKRLESMLLVRRCEKNEEGEEKRTVTLTSYLHWSSQSSSTLVLAE